MACLSRALKPALFGMLLLLIGAGFAFSAETDDSGLFVEAFNAYQAKDYLLAIEKVEQLNRIFHDSPLRDVALLLLARSGYKSGDNELAARTINRFMADFGTSPLKTTIEEDIASLGIRQHKGEKLAPNKTLQMAARKVRDDVLAQERAVAEKREQQRLAKLRAEQERLAREKAEAERKERERLAAEKADKESIKVAVSFPVATYSCDAGEQGTLAFEVTSRSKNREEFVLETGGVVDVEARIAAAAKPEERLGRIALAPGETFKGVVRFRMPSDRLDGHRGMLSVTAISARYADVTQSRDALLVASAPLVRVVAKPMTPKPSPGEQVRYRITVLNAGSLGARGLAARIGLPHQLEALPPGAAGYRLEKGDPVFGIDRLDSGRLEEILLDVKVRQDAAAGIEVKPYIEITNSTLRFKETFPAVAVTIRPR